MTVPLTKIKVSDFVFAPICINISLEFWLNILIIVLHLASLAKDYFLYLYFPEHQISNKKLMPSTLN